jgi:hypothetical protein
MKLSLLRNLLLLDAAVLFLLGALLVFAPQRVESVFGFKDLPQGVSYIIGLWGCALATAGVGYVVASTDPLRHVIWIQVAIARGALECILGLIYIAKETVTLGQAGFGIALAGLISIAYIVLYPRQAVSTVMPQPQGQTPPQSQSQSQ